jgi:acetylornithine/succinyldiaminopimelate/putrescine aminotransferase/predicted amino acid dehydrogenase
MTGPRRKGVRPFLSQRRGLEVFGLDASYRRAEGSRLWYGDSEDRPVWDFLGGYGSTFFGHNHPELSRAAIAFLERAGVVHGQASVRPESERLAAALARRLHETVGGSYEVLLANTGSEAVEVAARHSEEALEMRRDNAEAWAEAEPRASGRDPAAWSPEATKLLAAHAIDPGPLALARIAEHNRGVLDCPFVHLAVRRSYHGMSARAFSLTHDPGGRFGRGPKMADVRFVDADTPDDVARVLRERESTLLRIRRGTGGLRLEAEPWTPVAGLFLEPIQGEGGIHPLPREVAQAWREACRRHGVPLIADEIQSGLGRTGSFLYCEQIGIRPDYVLLGKSLGGGIAKLSAVAITSERFIPAFTLWHSSTFAGDGLSSHVAERALAVLDEERALDTAAEKGERLLSALCTLAARHPSVIKEVRGRGLMIGVEWQEANFEASHALHDLREYGFLGYALSGYLLRAHGIRVAPTLSSHNTLRLEPAYSVPPEAIDQLLAALEDLCRLLEKQDAATILAPCLGLERPPERHTAPVVRRVFPTPRPDSHVGFVGHLINAADLRLWDESFSRLDSSACERFLEGIAPVVEPVVTHRDRLTSITGKQTVLTFIGLAVPSRHFYHALRTRERRDLRDLVQRAVDRAAAEGCSVVGLGGYSSIVTRNGRDLEPRGLGITTGNGYTVAAGLEAMRDAAAEAGIEWQGARAAVVGATGNIGSVLAELMAAEVGSLVLLGRESRLGDLESLAGRILRRTVHHTPDAPLARGLRHRGLGPECAPEGGDRAVYRAVKGALGPGCPIEVGSDPSLCHGARLIAAVSNQASGVLFPEHLCEGPIVINDLSVPSDVDPSVARERPEARVIRGGVVRTPRNPTFRVPGVPLPAGEMYACMAETVLMGFEGHEGHGSLGRLTPERVRATLEMASRHGFSSVRTLVERSY